MLRDLLGGWDAPVAEPVEEDAGVGPVGLPLATEDVPEKADLRIAADL